MNEKKLSVGATLSEAFAIYRDQAGVLLPVAFWLFLVVAVLEGLLEDSLALIAVIPLSLAVTFLYQGMVVGLVKDVQDGRRDSSVGELMRSVLPVLLPLIGAGILVAIGTTIGIVLLIAPGLYLLTIWAVTAPVIVVERRGVFAALGRSRHLVRDNGWPVLGTILIAVLIGIVVAIVLAALAGAIADGRILEIVFSALASTVTAPIEALVAAVLYFRLREIKGEPDAAQPQAEGLTAPEAPTAPVADPPPPPPPPA
jgi:hypothetical protein